MLEPLLLQPIYKNYLWGGKSLKTKFNKITDISPLAESWELSCHKDGLCTIVNPTLYGKTLLQYIQESPENIIGTKWDGDNDNFPILIKLIDAEQQLSLQVHPSNEYAQIYENDSGKTEMWYIIDALEGAQLIYGLKNKCTKDEFAHRIQNNTIMDICNVVKVKKGDIYFIDPGTIHAIGAGLIIAEIQQSSNSTYRIYDYNRKDKDGKLRPLHITKALDVINFNNTKEKTYTLLKNDNSHWSLSCKYFTTEYYNINNRQTFTATKDSFHTILVLDGTLRLESEPATLIIKKGQTVFIPADMGAYTLFGKAEFLKVSL